MKVPTGGKYHSDDTSPLPASSHQDSEAMCHDHEDGCAGGSGEIPEPTVKVWMGEGQQI